MPAPRSHLALGLGIAVALLLCVAGSAHNTSLGRSTFALDEGGAVAIAIEMEERDVLEVFDVDLSSPQEAPLLDKRAASILTRFVRLESDGARCPVHSERWERAGPRAVRFHLAARCKPGPEKLTLDWGLSTLTPLDLRSMATLTAPGGVEHTALLTRQTPRAELVVARPSTFATFGRFTLLGAEHILLGWDHLAFLLALLLACARYRRLLLVVSGFTVAHSVTLALGALDMVRVTPAIVEPVIAASIAVAALVAGARLYAGTLAHPGGLLAPGSAWPELALVFGFGLVHGLGFATLLKDALGETANPTVPLLGFNLGVELGQLLAVSVAFPLLVLVGRRSVGRPVFLSLLAGLLALGAYVAVARVLAG